MTPKEQVLGSIRRGLRRSALSDEQAAPLRQRVAAHPRHLIPARSRIDHAAQITLFIANVTKEYGTVIRVGGVADVPGAISDYLASQNLPSRIVVAPHPALRDVPWHDRPLLEIREGRAGPLDPVSVTQGFAAIAETGTLMLPSAPERPTTLNLLPDTAIVVLQASRVVGPYEDAWDLLRAEGGMPRNVMLVTGPSRSADIEQTLELGAHGPRNLHVVLIEDHVS